MKTPTNTLLSISYSHPSQKTKAETLAAELELPCQQLSKAQSELTLNYAETLVEIIDLKNKMSINVDFISGSLGHRKKYGGGKGQTVAKAIGMKQGQAAPSIIDATAGLGKDSYVFACLGCNVTMLERSAIVCALVEDAIQRASLNIEFNEILEHGFKLVQTDARSFIDALEPDNDPDVIYMDPMYPERKKSASVKKNMQILQKLLGQDEDTAEVLESALKHARKRVVVKRPKGAPVVQASVTPTLKYESKATRYDVYITKPRP